MGGRILERGWHQQLEGMCYLNWAAAAAEHAVTMLRSRVGRVLDVVGRPIIEQVLVAGRPASTGARTPAAHTNVGSRFGPSLWIGG